jgi:tetratricopeptide (TPR) repeat protein
VGLLAMLLLTGCKANPAEAGLEYLENGEYDQAIASFEQAIEDEINVGDAYRGIGLAKWEQEDYSGAKEAFTEALEQGVAETGTLNNMLGNCDLKLGNLSEALSSYNHALEDENNSAELTQEIQYNIIVVYEQMDDLKSAKVKLQDYVEAYPDDAEAQKELEFLETR